MIVRTAAKMRSHLDDFSGKLSAGLSKPARRFVSEALYGIAVRGSVHLSEIGRALEERIALIKTEARLSRNLGLAEMRELLGTAVLREGSARIGARTLLNLGISDIAKPYAQKMEYLARARTPGCAAVACGGARPGRSNSTANASCSGRRPRAAPAPSSRPLALHCRP